MRRKLTIIASLLAPISLLAQDEPNQGVREELQRYIGYEPGTFKYLTLPYDQTMGSNITGNYLDIGFLILALLGMYFLMRIPKKPWQYAVTVLCILGFFSMSLYYGKVLLTENLMASINQDGFTEAFAKTNPSWLDNFVVGMYQLNASMWSWLYDILERLFAKKDYLSIPVLSLAFLGILYAVNKQLKSSGSDRSFQLAIVALSCTTFFWFLLSAGVIWYGFIIFVLASILLVGAFGRKLIDQKLHFIVFLSPIVLWLLVATVFKTTNIYYASDRSNLFIDPSIWMYYSGEADKDFVLNSYKRYSSLAINELNDNPDAGIYKVGTSFNSLIKNNDERIFEDNLLSFFSQIQREFRDEEIAPALKASGMDYILIGLKTWSIDNTPEKSLQKKFRDFMGYIGSADALELVSTDRRVKVPGREEPMYGMNGEVVDYGYYALYRIK